MKIQLLQIWKEYTTNLLTTSTDSFHRDFVNEISYYARKQVFTPSLDVKSNLSSSTAKS